MGIGIGVVAFAVVSVGFVGGMRLIVGIRLVVDRDITGVALVVDTIDRVFDVVAGLGGAIGGLVDLANLLSTSPTPETSPFGAVDFVDPAVFFSISLTSLALSTSLTSSN